jgi:hypothetical protein
MPPRAPTIRNIKTDMRPNKTHEFRSAEEERAHAASSTHAAAAPSIFFHSGVRARFGLPSTPLMRLTLLRRESREFSSNAAATAYNAKVSARACGMRQGSGFLMLGGVPVHFAE